MKTKNDKDLDSLLKSFYSASLPEQYKSASSEVKLARRIRKPLLAACAVLCIFAILTVSFLILPYLKRINNKAPDKTPDDDYCTVTVRKITVFSDFLSYVASDLSCIDKDNLFIPMSPLPFDIVTTYINVYDYSCRYTCEGTYNGKKYTVDIEFTPEKEKDSNYHYKHSTVNMLHYGEKYKIIDWSGSFSLFLIKDGFLIEYSFRINEGKDDRLIFSEKLAIAESFYPLKPVFSDNNTAILECLNMDDRTVTIGGKEKVLKYRHTEIDLVRKYETYVYSDGEKNYYMPVNSDDIIGYEVLEPSTQGQTLCYDQESVAEEFLKALNIDITGYKITKGARNGNFFFNYTEYMNGYKTTNQVEVEVDRYGNVISYIYHQRQLPAEWKSLIVDKKKVKGSLYLNIEELVHLRKGYDLIDISVEDFYPILRSTSDDGIVKVKLHVVDGTGKAEEITLFVHLTYSLQYIKV